MTQLDAPARPSPADITVAAALTDLLIDAGVDIVFTSSGAATLRKRETVTELVVGWITGRVTDEEHGQPVSEAQVGILGTKLSSVTEASGRYTIHGVTTGDVQLTVRHVAGFVPKTQTVSVQEGTATTADFALARVVTKLDQMVTTATGEQRRREVGNVVGNIRRTAWWTRAPSGACPICSRGAFRVCR